MFRRALLLRHSGRLLSSEARALTLEQAMTSSHLILSELESPQMVQAMQGAASQGDRLQKWQTANAVLIQATLRTLPQVGFSADAAGLHAYTEAFAAQARSPQPEVRSALAGVNVSKWRTLLRHAFGCDPAPPIERSAARALAIDMVDALQDEALLAEVAGSREGLGSRLSDQEHQLLVARAVVNVQAEVMAKHGFEGDAGFAQAQVCLMEHAHDAVVTASVAAATTSLYARAGINLQETFRQATGAPPRTASGMKVTASEFIAQSLVDAGVRTVYGGHGGALVPLVNAVVDHPELLWVCTRNEANASLMAAADAKLRLGLAACIATSGPGASNLVTGLLDAHLDRVPLIAITGTKPRSDLAHSEFQDIDQSRLFAAGGLSYSVTVSDPLQLVAVMRDAVATALTHHCCVHVGVPVDIQGALLSAPEHLCSANPAEMKRRVEAQIGDPDDIAGIAELLASGKEREPSSSRSA
ncbi:carboxylyase [Emiliania huxleyi CCMP1516]|uniref:Thiamine pyrophosphate enzyme N-terminal TPP-binding domain-containing protein n=2 Tax=Emiliania huxleyi TaxID=2903 RepID=A0A0D3J5C1_EMIH1|nr:carboxylyase [Emiliania huxleyi CCMP1516]EOD18706.1 carboxylyase [Emiliania huxleyi CCMP1516]|eukprot:XP_005771135.1 carboxylyase [Emiliania huxleyi CCMP1516]